MFKNVILILSLLIVSNSIFSQDWNEIYFLENEAHYLVIEQQYDKAIDNYKRILRDVPNHSLIKYYIGKTYLLTDDQKDKAIDFLKEASEDVTLDFNAKSIKETKAPVDALLYLGDAYLQNGKIDEASDAFNNLKSLINSSHELYEITTHKVKTCENAKAAINKPLRIKKTNLGDLVNDINSNVNPVISGDGNTLVFTTYKRDDMDVYYSTKSNGIWGTPKRITDKVSSKYYLKTVSLSFDGKELYLATDDIERNDIFVSYKEGKNWTDAIKLDKTVNGKKTNETHAVVSKDGNTLYFTSDREGGLGGIDIYKCIKDAKGKWGPAENLGPNINTKFDEATPFITLDDKYLFFSSQGHTSIGGFDVFYSKIKENGQPINIGYPINSTGDDIFYVPDNSLNTGLISRFDETSVGKNDIYRITILPKINIAGNIINSKNGETISDDIVSISLIDAGTNNVIEMIGSNNGSFKFEIDPGDYIVSLNNENYEAFNTEVNIPNSFDKSEFTLDASLIPIEVEQEELVAEVIEEPTVEPEVIIETPIEQIPETVETIDEETIEEPVIEQVAEPAKEQIIEKEIKKPEPEVAEPKKEIVKYTPIPKSTVTNMVKTYSVQLMALKKPIDISFFKNIEGVQEKLYEDGYYRYTVGNTNTYAEAVVLKEKINAKGYKDAYIRENNIIPEYTIQIMALIIPVEENYFENLTSVMVTKGADDYYRYTIGKFSDFNEAKQELAKLAELGYKNAYVKRNK